MHQWQTVLLRLNFKQLWISFWWKSPHGRFCEEQASPLLHICHSVLPMSASLRPPSTVPWITVLVLCWETWPNQTIQLVLFHCCEKCFLASHEDGSRAPTKSLVLCFLQKIRIRFLKHLVSNTFGSVSRLSQLYSRMGTMRDLYICTWLYILCCCFARSCPTWPLLWSLMQISVAQLPSS